MRLVLDTNIVVAGLLWSGPPRRLLDMAVDSGVEFFSSPVLIEELAHTLSYAKFADRINGFGTSVDELVARYAASWRTIRMTITSSPRPSPRRQCSSSAGTASTCCPSAAMRESASSPPCRRWQRWAGPVALELISLSAQESNKFNWSAGMVDSGVE
jgi:putative PIN family toxin of toxin-antitoxin system